MIQFKKTTKAQAKEFVMDKNRLPNIAFDELMTQWKQQRVEGYDDSYNELRERVIQIYTQNKSNTEYEIDLKVGLCLYKELNPNSGFTNVMANDDDIWRYLSCFVFPDITHLRYPPKRADIEEGNRLNTKRFYAHTRRIWLKTLWWYIHLSWQGSESETYNVLKNLGVDTIGHLIERPGRGYRLPLYRALIKEYSAIADKSSDLFNEIQKQNLIYCRNVEPALSDGGESGYVSRLIYQFVKKG